MNTPKLSLPLAILININVIIGGAFFISSGIIARKTGALAPLYWLLVGAILLPLVASLADLANKYPVAGGIYVYSERLLGSFWGFLSGWGYYIGTAAGNAVLLLAFRGRLADIGIGTGIAPLTFDVLLVLLFSFLNLFNIEFLGRMQVLFTMLKIIPFMVVLVGAYALFSPENLTGAFNVSGAQLVDSIPLVLFAYIGVETCCAIGHLIKDGEKNASKAIYTSFGIIIAIYAIMQLCIVGIHGGGDVNPFLDILPRLTTNPSIIYYGNLSIQVAILSSFLGGYYSMFYANNWTLHKMASEDQIHFSGALTQMNKSNAPWGAVAFQTVLIIGLLALSRSIEDLTTMSDFGIVIAYLLSSLAFVVLQRNNGKIAIGLLSLASCSYLLYVCSTDLMRAGVQYLLPFIALLGLGVLSFVLKRR